jgi:hypothetical protein
MWLDRWYVDSSSWLRQTNNSFGCLEILCILRITARVYEQVTSPGVWDALCMDDYGDGILGSDRPQARIYCLFDIMVSSLWSPESESKCYRCTIIWLRRNREHLGRTHGALKHFWVEVGAGSPLYATTVESPYRYAILGCSTTRIEI